MNNSQTRKKVSICNYIVMAICAIVLICYLVFPFWSVTLSLTLTAENIEEMIGEEDITLYEAGVQPMSIVTCDRDLPVDNGSLEEDFSFEGLDIKKIIGDEEIVISAGVSISSGTMLGSLFSDPSDTVEDLLRSNVENIVDQLDEPLSKIAKNAATQVSTVILKEQIKDEIRNLYTDEKSEAEVQNILNEANITDAYIEQKTEQIVNSLYEEGATTDSVAATIVNTVDEVCEKLRESDNEEFADLVLSPEDKAELKVELKDVLQEIAKEDGSINGDELVSRLLLELLNESEQEGVQPSSATYEQKGNIALLAADNESEEDVKAQLKQKLYEMLEVPDDVVEILALVLRVLAGIFLLLMLTWLYLIIKILCKLKKPNNAIKLKMPILFGWWPALILFVVPTIGMSLLTSPSSPLAAEIGAEAMDTFSYFSVSFFSSTAIAMFVAIAMFFFSVCYYGRLRKRLKKEVKAAVAAPAENTESPAAPTYSFNDLQASLNALNEMDATDEIIIEDNVPPSYAASMEADAMANDTAYESNEEIQE